MGTKQSKNENPLSPPLPAWIELPGDLTADILLRLGAAEILKSAGKVCTTWRKVCTDPAMWRVVHLINDEGGDERESDLICRRAVDRSQGQLIELSIFGFGDDDLLNYVAHRSSNLRRLNVVYPRNVSAFGLIEAVKKLPQLEELGLLDDASLKLGAEDVETIRNSCPLLKSFTHDASFNFCSIM